MKKVFFCAVTIMSVSQIGIVSAAADCSEVSCCREISHDEMHRLKRCIDEYDGVSLIELLKRSTIHPDARPEGRGETLLVYNVRESLNTELTESLVSLGADIEHKWHGLTPLAYAICAGKKMQVAKLLKLGANKGVKIKITGESLTELAERRKRQDCSKWDQIIDLIKVTDVERKE